MIYGDRPGSDSYEERVEVYRLLKIERRAMPMIAPREIINGELWFPDCDCMACQFGLKHASHCILWGRRTTAGDIETR